MPVAMLVIMLPTSTVNAPSSLDIFVYAQSLYLDPFEFYSLAKLVNLSSKMITVFFCVFWAKVKGNVYLNRIFFHSI